jgi:hypothetical protein
MTTPIGDALGGLIRLGVDPLGVTQRPRRITHAELDVRPAQIDADRDRFNQVNVSVGTHSMPRASTP